MIITRISATGLKGKNFTHELHPAQAIVGPNFSGKTAIIEAIRLCLMGYLPEVGKTPRSTWELASDGEMTVLLTFDNHQTLSRRFWCGMESRIKTEVEGFHPIANPADFPLLQADRYFGMTDTERTNYVFSMLSLPDSFTEAAIMAELERHSFGEEHSEQIEEAKADCVAKIRCVMDAEPTIQAKLTLAVEHLQTQFTYWNKRAKDTQGAVVVLAELKLREKEVRAAAADAGAIPKLQGELEELNVTSGKLAAQQGQAERIAARAKTIGIQLAGLPNDWDERIAKGKRLIESETRKLGKEMTSEEYNNVKIAINANREERAELFRSYQTDLQSLAHANEGISKLEEMECCPYCKSTGDQWKENLRAEFQRTIDEVQPRYLPAKEKVSQLDAFWKQQEAVIGTADKVRLENISIRSTISNLQTAVEHAIRQKAADEARRVELHAELKTLQEEPKVKEGDLWRNTERATTIRGQIKVLQIRKDEETRLLQDLKRAAEAELEHLDAAAHVAVIKAFGKLLKERREAMVTEIFGNLLKVANMVTGDILLTPLALHENTIGRWADEGKFIPHRVFSGTEKALAYIAIAVALSAQSKLRLVILDEFGRLDESNQGEVLKNLTECVRMGAIDQFIVVGTTLPETGPPELEVIQTNFRGQRIL